MCFIARIYSTSQASCSYVRHDCMKLLIYGFPSYVVDQCMWPTDLGAKFAIAANKPKGSLTVLVLFDELLRVNPSR